MCAPFTPLAVSFVRPSVMRRNCTIARTTASDAFFLADPAYGNERRKLHRHRKSLERFGVLSTAVLVLVLLQMITTGTYFLIGSLSLHIFRQVPYWIWNRTTVENIPFAQKRHNVRSTWWGRHGCHHSTDIIFFASAKSLRKTPFTRPRRSRTRSSFKSAADAQAFSMSDEMNTDGGEQDTWEIDSDAGRVASSKEDEILDDGEDEHEAPPDHYAKSKDVDAEDEEQIQKDSRATSSPPRRCSGPGGVSEKGQAKSCSWDPAQETQDLLQPRASSLDSRNTIAPVLVEVMVNGTDRGPLGVEVVEEASCKSKDKENRKNDIYFGKGGGGSDGGTEAKEAQLHSGEASEEAFPHDVHHRELCKFFRKQFLAKDSRVGENALRQITAAGVHAGVSMAVPDKQSSVDELFQFWCDKIKLTVQHGEKVDHAQIITGREKNIGKKTLIVPVGEQEDETTGRARRGFFRTPASNSLGRGKDSVAPAPFTAQAIVLDDEDEKLHEQHFGIRPRSVKTFETMPVHSFYDVSLGKRLVSLLDDGGPAQAAEVLRGSFGVSDEPKHGQIVKVLACRGSKCHHPGKTGENREGCGLCPDIAEEIFTNLMVSHATNKRCVAQMTRIVSFVEATARAPIDEDKKTESDRYLEHAEAGERSDIEDGDGEPAPGIRPDPAKPGTCCNARCGDEEYSTVYLLFFERVALFADDGDQVPQNLYTTSAQGLMREPGQPERLTHSFFQCLAAFSTFGFVHNDLRTVHLGCALGNRGKPRPEIKLLDLGGSSFVALDIAGKSTGVVVFGRQVVVDGVVTPILHHQGPRNPILYITGIGLNKFEGEGAPIELSPSEDRQRKLLLPNETSCNSIAERATYGPALDWYGAALGLIMFFDPLPEDRVASWDNLLDQDVFKFGIANAQEGCGKEMRESTMFPGRNRADEHSSLSSSPNILLHLEASLRDGRHLSAPLVRTLLTPLKYFWKPEWAQKETRAQMKRAWLQFTKMKTRAREAPEKGHDHSGNRDD
ncbi:unnamed protein product [Amoebophrya sp. A120]|nr:unnamed protein product [Amoebophrya sp. A120]|eukprot:GSA120T00020332001.1